MSINRHNYEEFFILYMDNELSSEDRRMVEAFVHLHPDLKDELDALTHYKLIPDTSVIFQGKEELLKENGHSLITASNYEEWLTLYADNELTTDQMKAVEQFISRDKEKQLELELVMKTRLEPEIVLFPGKESLYRTEEKRRIFPVRWRAAAAILVILLLSVSALLVFNKKGIDPNKDVAGEQSGKQTEPVKQAPVFVKENNSPVNAPAEKQTASIDPVTSTNDDQLKLVQVKDKNKAVAENKNKIVSPVQMPENDPSPVIKKDEQVVADNNNKPSNNLPQPKNNTNVFTGQPDNINPETDPVKENKSPFLADNPNVTKQDDVTSPYIQAANTELEQPDGKKNKNRGIFRKIARTFEKRTSIDPTDDNKLLVGGLAIKLK